MITRAEYYKIIIFFSIIFVIILFQYLISESMEKASLPIIKYLQNDEYLVSAMEYVTLLGSKRIKIFLMVLTYSLCNVYHSFIFTIASFISILTCSWLKINLQVPRPFWIDDDVKAFDCESGYGYPSNHVLSTVPAFFMFFEIMYYHYELDRAVNGKIFYWVGFIINTLICISVGFSRLVLGVHSLDQVFFGLLMGFASYYFYLHVIDYSVDNFKPFLDEISNPFQKARIIVITITIYICFLINILLSGIRYEPIWTERIIRKCGQLPSMTPFYKDLADTGDYFVVFGMIIGILFDIKYHYLKRNGNKNIPIYYIHENISDKFLASPNIENRVGKWNDTSLFLTFARTLILYTLFLIVFSLSEYLVTFFDINILTFYIFCRMIPNVIRGFLIFGYGRTICYYLKLTNLSTNEKHI